jgi:hypothetical protein
VFASADITTNHPLVMKLITDSEAECIKALQLTSNNLNLPIVQVIKSV